MLYYSKCLQRYGRYMDNQAKFQYLFNLFQPDDPIRVFEIGCHKTPPSHAFGPAIRPYYLLHLIEKGEGYIERNGVKTKLTAGMAFLIQPNEVTLYCSDADNPWEYTWIAFDGAFASTLTERTTDKLCMEYQKSGLIVLKNALQAKKADCLSCLSTLFEVLNSIKTTAPPANEDEIASALHYLENNYFHPIDIQNLATRFGFSRAYFSTLFVKRTGETPYDYLTKIRIDRAKDYLKQGQHSVEEIAFSVGFSSLQRFSETFKKRVGLSPLQYRKAITV